MNGRRTYHLQRFRQRYLMNLIGARDPGRPNPIARRDRRAHEVDSRHHIVDEVIRVRATSIWHVQRSKPDFDSVEFFLNHSEP